MIKSKHTMNGNDKLTWKVDLMKANESQGVDNNLDKDKSTCLNNQDKMTTQFFCGKLRWKVWDTEWVWS
jgi:hypothetical protein